MIARNTGCSLLISPETESVRTLATAKEIRELGVRAVGLRLDVTQPEDIRSAAATLKEKLGTIDILVNNAGVMDNLARIEKQTDRMWERDLTVNLTGAFNCIRAFWSDMKQAKWGRIINISSFVGLSGAYAQPGYGASKAGLIGLTKSLALEGARYSITVNAILPGFIQTEALMLHQPEMLERVKKRIAMNRLGKPGSCRRRRFSGFRSGELYYRHRVACYRRRGLVCFLNKTGSSDLSRTRGQSEGRL